jgi:hypothetical protein
VLLVTIDPAGNHGNKHLKYYDGSSGEQRLHGSRKYATRLRTINTGESADYFNITDKACAPQTLDQCPGHLREAIWLRALHKLAWTRLAVILLLTIRRIVLECVVFPMHVCYVSRIL